MFSAKPHIRTRFFVLFLFFEFKPYFQRIGETINYKYKLGNGDFNQTGIIVGIGARRIFVKPIGLESSVDLDLGSCKKIFNVDLIQKENLDEGNTNRLRKKVAYERE